MDWNGAERRKFPRINFKCRMHIGKAGEVVSLETENIGPGGVRVVLQKEFPVDTVIDIELFPQVGKTIVCKGVVVWVMKRFKRVRTDAEGSEGFITGIRVTNIDEDDRQYLYQLIDQIKARDASASA